MKAARIDTTIESAEESRMIPDAQLVVLAKALALLDEKHRLVFLLRDVEGMPAMETADVLGLSESNVKVRLLRARLQLREHLTRTLGDPQTRIERGHPRHD